MMSPHTSYRASDYLRKAGWPEEDLTATTDEGGGFYPLRIGEMFNGGRFIITRKLGWGGGSSVWLAKDREYAPRECRQSPIHRQLIQILKQS